MRPCWAWHWCFSGPIWLWLWPVWAMRPQIDGSLHPDGPPSSANSTGCDKTLFFAAVGPEFRDTMRKNALHLHATGVVDIFFAHYRQDLANWQKESWYQETVKYSVSYKEMKADFVLKELVKQETFRLRGYCWYWIADDNVDFTSLDVKRYLALAAETGASLVQPAVEFDSHGIPSHQIVTAYSADVELPDHSISRSLYRYSDFVEVMSPLFREDALIAAWKLYLPGLGSDFGMDFLWCRFVAAQLRARVDRVCAIIDAEHMYKLPHLESYNFEDGLAVQEVLLNEFAEYTQRSMETSGQLRDDLEQLCRTAKDTQLVRVRVKPYLAQASWKMWKALFRCKQYNLEAVCHIDGTLINGVFWRVLAAGLVLCIPLLLWPPSSRMRRPESDPSAPESHPWMSLEALRRTPVSTPIPVSEANGDGDEMETASRWRRRYPARETCCSSPGRSAASFSLAPFARYVLQQLRSALQVVRRPETFKRPLRAPYRHQISDAS
ncbi:unnamed protein product [Durusdinium trenchii]|uniref:Uncharacterized protein n=2 Tax=Durusdinium trenchii TaxID=1381693 RepID=A0ABP0H929_9DINO